MRKTIGAAVAAAAVASAVVTGVAPEPAGAQVGGACVPEFASGPDGYRFARCFVPDFDQRRDDLMGGGRSHCMPTSASDWLVYLIRRGATDVQPGPDWGSDHADISTIIGAVGNRMSTDTTPVTGGTNYDDAVAGLISWFDSSYDGRGGDYFTVHQNHGYVSTPTGGGIGVRRVRPTAEDLAEQGAAGSLVIATMGWYVQEGGGYVRNGGHAVALTTARPATFFEGTPGDYILGFNDPSDDDGNPAAQGPEVTDPALAAATPTDITVGPVTARMDKLFGDGYSAGWLEGMVVITPKFGLFPDPEGGRLQLRRALPLDQWPSEVSSEPLDGKVVDLALRPSGVRHTALLEDGRVLAVDQVTGETSTIGTFPAATGIVIDDRLRTALIDSDGRITVLDRHGNPALSLDLPGAAGLAYSPRLESLVTYDGAAQQLLVVDEDENGGEPEVRRLDLGPAAPAVADLSIDPSSGIVGLLEPGTGRLMRIRITEGRFVTVDDRRLGDGSPLEGLVADATGSWYSTRDGHIVAFDADGDELPDNPFAGQRSTPDFAIFQPIDIGEAPEGPHVMPEDAPHDGVVLSADPEAATRAIGERHDVVLHLTDQEGTPLGGHVVHYEITGANPAAGSTTTDGAGVATVNWSGTAPGIDRLHALAQPDGRIVAEVTWTTPAPVATALSLSASANPAIAGRSVTLTATVRTEGAGGPTPEGTVTFTEDGVALGPPVEVGADGRARLTTSWPTSGRHLVEAGFEPAAGTHLLPSKASLEVRVRCHLLDVACLLRGLIGGRP
ncbi:MAG: Ig-like domain repeat protein [Acidimicrobiia bacterium]